MREVGRPTDDSWLWDPSARVDLFFAFFCLGGGLRLFPCLGFKAVLVSGPYDESYNKLECT